MQVNISTIAQSAIGLGALAGGFGFLYQQFWGGRNKQQADVTEVGVGTLGYLTAQVKGLQDLVKQNQEEAKERERKHQEEMKSLHGQIENFRGQLQEKDKLLDHYTQIFQGRDPQLTEILKSVAASLAEIKGFINEMKNNVSARQGESHE